MKQIKRKPILMLILSCVLVCGVIGFTACSGKKADQAGDQGKKDQEVKKDDVKKQPVGENPLLGEFKTPFGTPPFDKIKEEHYMPAFKKAIEMHKKEIEAIVKNTAAPDFDNTVKAFDKSGLLLSRVQFIFSAMNSANTNEKMQALAKEIRPMLSAHNDAIMMNPELFKRVKAVYDQKDKLELKEDQASLLKYFYKEFIKGGSGLPADKQAQLKDINKKLSVLELKFGENILKETNRFKMVIEKKEDLDGLPDSVISAAAEAAKERKLEGKWVFTLHKPSLIPFLQFSTKRELREKMFKGYIMRCDHNDELDNKEVIKKLMKLRTEKAKLLSYKNYAEYMLDVRMAKKPKAVYDLLNKLWTPALAMAKKEAKELQAMIDKEGGKFKLQPWDWWYYAEKLRNEKYDLDDKVLRPYFKLENVRDGAFYVASKLYNIKFIERKDIPTYHKDVQVFEVQHADGKHIGIIYLDFFPRASKRGGAWMNELRKQEVRDGKFITPIVTNNGNFTKPTGDMPSLLSFDEVETLFHEFGHGLHGLLSNNTYFTISGTDVPMDFVELPSQIMEHWVFEPDVLKVYAKHYKTGEVIPQELVDKIRAAGLFNQGFATVEYLAASFLDMDWHTAELKDDVDVNKFEKESLDKIGLIPEIVTRYRTTYFNHIFSSIYPAGYYSYIWAAVLDADAFQAFKETSLFDQETAKKFREHVLSKGGSAEPMVLYKRFRGKEPSIEPLLKKRGLK